MKLFKKIIALSSIIVICFSCTQRPARIVSGSGFYGKNSTYNKGKYRNLSYGRSLKGGKVEVVSGDTLYGISRRHQVPLRDLIEQNNLTPPYILRSGEWLTIPAPSYHKVQSGETLSGIARLYNMNIDNIVALNNLEPPYRIQVDQNLRISNNSAQVRSASTQSRTKAAEAKKPTKTYTPNFVERTLDKFNHFSWPINGKVVSKFGPKSGGLYNDGINIKAAEGSDVKASEDGEVAYVGNELKGYGNLVIVKHSGGWITAYAHLSKTMVKKGQKVAKLETIAKVGSTGNVSSPQLYFGLRKGRDAVNPENYLKK